jgi:transcriptional regulator with XRE-family HTH domain
MQITGAELRARRKRLGWKNEQLANRLGIGMGTLSKAERSDWVSGKALKAVEAADWVQMYREDPPVIEAPAKPEPVQIKIDSVAAMAHFRPRSTVEREQMVVLERIAATLERIEAALLNADGERNYESDRLHAAVEALGDQIRRS